MTSVAFAPKDNSASGAEVGDDEDLYPDTVARRCTDVPCLVIFCLGNVALGLVIWQAILHGELTRETSFSETDGDACGFGSNFARPYVYWCVNSTPADPASGTGGPVLDTSRRLCVAQCPSNSTGSYDCRSGPAAGYPTFEFLGLMCKPYDRNLTFQLKHWIRDHVEAKLVVRFHTLHNVSMPFLGCAVLGIAGFLVYLHLLGQCASTLVWTVFTLLSVLPLSTGAFLSYCWYSSRCYDHALDILGESSPSIDLAMGVLLILIGVIFLGMAWRRGDSIDLAVECLEAACECIRKIGALRCVPVIALLGRAVVLVGCGSSFLLLLTTGDQMQDDHPVLMLYRQVTQIQTTTQFTVVQWTGMLVLLVMLFWDMQVVMALTDFVSVYLTQVWFFRAYDGDDGMPHCLLGRAYWDACRYHLGSLTLGGFVLGATTVPRTVLDILASNSRNARNPLTLLLSTACCLCVSCFESFLAPLSHDAWMELTMTGKPFWEAASQALILVRNEDDAVRILNGVTWLFQIGGLMGIAALGHTLTLITVSSVPAYSDPTSEYFVYNKQLMAWVGMGVTAVAALPFMMIFDLISDTIIFCYSVQRTRLDNNNDDLARAATKMTSRYCSCLSPGLACAVPRLVNGHGLP